MTTVNCPACGKPVLEVGGPGGGTVRYSPRPVTADEGHVELAGRHYRAHRCQARGAENWRKAQAGHAARHRTQRAQPARAPFPATGPGMVRVTPDGGRR